MFRNIWRWAGSHRRSGKSVGIDAYQFATALRLMIDDCRYWIEKGTYPSDEIAARFHHRLVQAELAKNNELTQSFEYQKDGQKLAIVKQASPVAWYNINLKGTYRFKSTGKLPDLEQMMRHIDGYRPVR